MVWIMKATVFLSRLPRIRKGEVLVIEEMDKEVEMEIPDMVEGGAKELVVKGLEIEENAVRVNIKFQN